MDKLDLHWDILLYFLFMCGCAALGVLAGIGVSALIHG